MAIDVLSERQLWIPLPSAPREVLALTAPTVDLPGTETEPNTRIEQTRKMANGLCYTVYPDGSERVDREPFALRLHPETGDYSFLWTTKVSVIQLGLAFNNALNLAADRSQTSVTPIVSYAVAGDSPTQYADGLTGNQNSFEERYQHHASLLKWLHVDGGDFYYDGTLIQAPDNSIYGIRIMVGGTAVEGEIQERPELRYLVKRLTPINNWSTNRS